jgi:hypothetical protein
MRAPGELLARYQHCGGISTHIAESASKPPGIERAIVGNLRRLEAHEAFIDMTLDAFEVRWWGAKEAKAGLRVSMILDGGWTATQLCQITAIEGSASADDCMRNAAERESERREAE